MMTDRSGIEIDYCPDCRGVWLDRGELDKILERSGSQLDSLPPQTAAPQPQQPEYQPHYQPQGHPYAHGQGKQHGYGHKPYRKKSFLEELFD